MTFRDLDLRGSYSNRDDRLTGFFVPVLSESIAYDRVTGYFSSGSLISVARGLSRMLARGGRMRLIAGAELQEDDLRAIEEGRSLDGVLTERLLADPLAGAGVIEDHRLETLAWLVRERLLEIKIGVPTDRHGRPLRPGESEAYFHAKSGVFTDGDGNRVAFEGSNNESTAGHTQNYESFSVFPSWKPEVWNWSGEPVVARFEALWGGRPDADWKVLPLPQAVEERLVSRVRHSSKPPPARDPEEESHVPAASELRLLEFVAAAPRIGGGTGVGLATSGVEPLPHQTAIARRALDEFPRSFLFADEVGLGKTIEVGLVIRELLVSGRAERILILVPASVMRQWQEELDEKLALQVPRYEHGSYYIRHGAVDEEVLPESSSGNSWAAFPVLIGSSHLARRQAHQDAVKESGPWDIVVVDEAHHARRRGSKPTDPPNALLALLQQMKSAHSWRALYLASATPMQMYPHEAWDLLQLLELTPRWGRSAQDFVKYYQELREPYATRDWNFLQKMCADYMGDPFAALDKILEGAVRDQVGGAASRPIRAFHEEGLSPTSAEALPSIARKWLDEWLRRHTPTRDRVFRTTRKVMRDYKAQGLLPATTSIPQRSVVDRFIPMTEAEAALYERIEDYISRYYDAYRQGPAAQRALGFIMTVYRRRLTSSFLAIERSLRRRRSVLLGRASAEALLDPDDLAAIELSLNLDETDLSVAGQGLADEVQELDAFLDELDKRPPDESKMQYLHNELVEAFRGEHDTAIIFSQYADTMDYVRDHLTTFYGSKVACWSGRGGERWDVKQEQWVPCAKADLKILFREGKDIKILVGTDSMSEGLNLQTCGLLFNYDMPWNFMRVEQRIGRVDRINGRPLVDIRNFFYTDTVEEQIYAGIREDFDWFTDVVGPAQPVLGQVEGLIEHLAMLQKGQHRDFQVEAKLEEIRAAIGRAADRPITLQDLDSPAPLPEATRPAIDLRGLERVLLQAAGTRDKFDSHPAIQGAYLLECAGGKVPITFRRSVLDEYSPDVRLLTYGTTELDRLLMEAGIKTELLKGDWPLTLEELERELRSNE